MRKARKLAYPATSSLFSFDRKIKYLSQGIIPFALILGVSKPNNWCSGRKQRQLRFR